MALTINATPAAYSSVHDDLIYTVYSDKVEDGVTYPNYKYIADVYVNSMLVIRLKNMADPTTGIGIFNIGRIVRNYLDTTFDPGSGLRGQQIGSAAFHTSVQVKFGEEYNFTMYLDQTVDSARVFFNHYNKRNSTPLSSFTNKIASNAPLVQDVQLSDTHHFLPYFPTSTTAVNVTVTPVGGGSSYATSFSPSNAYDLQILNVAPARLNTLQAGTINASTTHYFVEVGTQTYRFNLICESIYEVTPLHFLNQYGGFDTKLFTKLSRRTVDITKKDFGKVPYNVDGDGVVSRYNSNNVYYETRATYSSQFVEKLTLNSDILTDSEYTWLEDLVLSPLVYLQDGTYFYPVIIKSDNYERRRWVNDESTNLTLQIEFGTQLNAQGR
jgi:hypothetical protein